MALSFIVVLPAGSWEDGGRVLAVLAALCRLDVRKAAAGPRSTRAPSPRIRRGAGRAA